MPTLDDYMAEHPEAAPKPKHWHPEWSLQTKIKGFVREFCAVRHEFVAHDRAYDATGKQHIFEAERGVRVRNNLVRIGHIKRNQINQFTD